MKMITFSKFGGPDVLQLEERGIPQPINNEVVIKVAAAGLNPIDYKIREGTSFVAQKLKDHLPSGLGYELAGEIIAIGEQITDFKVGDEVFGLAGLFDSPKCYAQYVVTTTDYLLHKPENLPMLQAGCMTTAALTALQALQLAPFGDNWRNKKVLIHAGAGGVGHIAVQLASQWGAEVITTASLKNHPFLYELGAHQCIDYRTQNVFDVIHHVDMVLDLVGGMVGMQSLALLSTSGCLVTVPTVTASKILEEAKQKDVMAMSMVMKPDMKQLAYLAQQAASDKLKIEIGKTFKLEEAQQAHMLLQAGHVRGKLVFSI